MTRTELSEAPNLPALFAKAAVTARGRGGDLPDTRLARTGVTADPAQLAAYARVCGFAVSDVLPPPFPHVLAFPLQVALMSDRSFPLALVGLVHVRNRIDVLRAVRADEALDRRCGPSGSRRTGRVLRSACARRPPWTARRFGAAGPRIWPAVRRRRRGRRSPTPR